MSVLDPANSLHAKFVTEFKQPAANFENDKELITRHKRRFIIHLDGFKTGSLREHLREHFCWKPANQQLGKVVSLASGEMVGRVVTMTAFARRINECTGRIIESADAEPLVRSLAYLTPEKLVKRLQRLMGADAKLSSRLMWSYRNPDSPREPTGISNTSVLPARLGLVSSRSAVPHVLMGYDLGATRARMPTFFDSGLNPQWRPGGKTLPCRKPREHIMKGLPELVHSPILVQQITKQLLVLG